ncbi:DEAD/DEAH box helicase [Nocardioides rotundus]|uniref:DEAD/DEAH box helicase n=1 Tax=Nocardioides rotundus TaxID=1774216 RepID=UPI001CBBCB6B|nr:DEAD/DEAH box helicase [Nocardioides rotundus]UAL31499.1 DEAD/DEAH box helicase [Nocardioides rotundus]
MSDEQTPAERYAASRTAQRYPVLHEFASFYDFGLDPFQLEACREVEDGRGVLVAAPTGSGKTVVGEFAVFLALTTGRKCFYTTPIKALSNQKFHDLVERHGAENVGLLTGDTSVNGEAPVVVMTTEVLRNMLYAGSPTLLGLAFVVMDEVHYLADRARGAVWEEVIIHLPESVQVISLSATVSNAEEFGEWLGTVRGEMTTIVEERRPVPLFQHVMAGRRLYDLFAHSDDQASAGFVGEGAPVNPELMRVARDDFAATRMRDRRVPKDKRMRGDHRKGSNRGRNVGNGRRVWIPSRVEVVERLERERLLPAIYFIFSRKGCDAAVQQCLDANVRLTSPEERDEIIEYVEAATAHLPSEDREVLGYHDFLDALSRGVAAHHAGLLPAFKECVETLFTRGLCKVVFATETLALGINMPARTVVIEKLSKWNGREHADLTPGEYTQLTGRAGRRGLDVEGHAVVLWQPGMNPQQVAGLASTRTYPLRSSFRPSYNMAVNLVNQFGRERSRELLEMSFAQFQADRAVVGLARQLRKAENALEGYAEAAHCDRGDFMEYAALRRRISEVEKGAKKAQRAERRDEAAASLTALRPGDVIDVPTGKFAGLAVVLDPGYGDQPRPQVLTLDRQVRRLSMIDFPVPVTALTRMKVPRNFNPRNPQQRRDLAGALRNRTRDLERPRQAAERRRGIDQETRDEVDALRAELKAHPCHGCPDREDHQRWADRWSKLDRDAETLRRRVERRTNTVARTFDRVCEVLAELGYLDLDDDGGRVTERGRGLRRIYSELDLLAAESLRLGLWDDLTVPELAAVLSALVYESRRDPDQPPRIPCGRVEQVLAEMQSLWGDLRDVEARHKLDFLREPDPGFAWAAYRWASGDDLDDILRASPLSAGDFVRATKQLIDLAGQVADAAGDSPLRRTARGVVDAVRRGVVAYSSLD